MDAEKFGTHGSEIHHGTRTPRLTVTPLVQPSNFKVCVMGCAVLFLSSR